MKNDVKTVKTGSTSYERNNDSGIKDCLKINEQDSSSISNIKSEKEKMKKKSLLIAN
jgi:hypothetical protein